MADIWVYKRDGTLQCESDPGISLGDAHNELATLIGGASILANEKRHLPFFNPALCGSPTGNVNACKITEEGAYVLFRGFVGPMGWQLWSWGDPLPGSSPKMFAGDRPVPWPWPWSATAANNQDALTNAISSLTQVGSQPTSLVELIGRRCRFYKMGDPITMDFIPQRVNFELDANSTVHRIWFG